MDFDHFLRDVLEFSKLCLTKELGGRDLFHQPAFKRQSFSLVYALIKHQDI